MKQLLFPLLFAALVALGYQMLEAQSQQHWKYKGCYTRQCVSDFLNQVQPTQTNITYDSDAAFDSYDIWYR